MTKVFVKFIILGVFGSVLVEEVDKAIDMSKFLERAEICKKQLGASDYDVLNLIEKRPSTTKIGQCLRFCVMEKCEVLAENGNFNKEITMSHMKYITNEDEDKMKIATEIVDYCATIDFDYADDNCEVAEQYAECFREQAKAHKAEDYFFIMS